MNSTTHLHPLRLRLYAKYTARSKQQENDEDGESDGILPPRLDLPDAKVFNDPREESAEHGPRNTPNAADDRGNDA